MPQKYTNLNPVPLFGHYSDPYADRRGTGPVRPREPLRQETPSFHRSYDPARLYFSWLGHSSVFLCMHGKTILIDPVFCKWTSPVPFFGPKRFPGTTLTPADLPAIDYVLLTHNHYDHMDRQTILSLDSQTGRYITPAGVGRHLAQFGIHPDKITELNWYQSFCEDSLRIICTPSQHDSARSPFDRDRTLWCSYVLKDGLHTVFDTGDGGFGSHFEDIHSRYGDVDLAIMECGQYNERWHTIHMFPEESVAAAQAMHAKLSVPVHWGAYVLSDHPWDDPPKRFQRRAEECALTCHIPVMHAMLTL